MSNYKDFFAQDFGERCSDLLTLLPKATRADREVTLLLSIAAAGLVIPHERLSHDSADPYKANQLSLKCSSLQPRSDVALSMWSD